MLSSASATPLQAVSKPSNETDEVLMLRYRNGETAAFEQLYVRHKGALYRYCLRQCSTTAVAEELFQDVWLKVINARANYTAQARFTTYLYRLAHNRLVDYYRAQSRTIPAVDCNDAEWTAIPTPACEQPEQQAERRGQAEQLLQLLNALPETQREAFLLREEGGLSLDAIAEVTGVNRETAKSRLRYAVAKLRQGLGALA
ncbi:MAG: RNA polymerase sigma factor [Candidatus Competibacteraceae bacterium]|jgi:RNA polymerase sigma-70 factor (ECF subfamily)|nr:RNA polymerase sigma factor [Candidatus Competibacteraceae bacterium]